MPTLDEQKDENNGTGERPPNGPITTNETHSNQMSLMEGRQLHSSQQEALKKIPEFSGEDNEHEINEWLFDLTNLFSLIKLNDETKILETMSKLTGPALRWYQQNLPTFRDWKSTEKALQERFKEHTSDGQLMREFFQLYQEENQSITSFYENVIRKHRRIQNFVSEQQVITVLQSGVKKSLQEFLIRQEKGINSPDKWLTLAREEEYVQKRLQQQSEDISQPKSEFTLPTATINTQQGASKYNERWSRSNGRYNNSQRRSKPTKDVEQTKNCWICNRRNHSTSECHYKKESGCYKCGQSNHRIRNCPQRHFFE